MKTETDMIGDFTEIPSQPEVVCRLQALIGRQEISSHQAAQIIEADQGFTARILRLVNSPFYGFSRQIVSVEGAITMLGFNAIHQLLLTSSLLSSLSPKEMGIDLHPFWKHSFGVGVLAKYLLPSIDMQLMDEAFISGIMHDVGRLVYMRTDFKRYAAFYNKSAGAISLEDERKYFGIDHETLGEALASKWNFPESVRTAIGFHHSPLLPNKFQRLTAVVNLADIAVHALNIGDSGHIYINEFYSETWTCLGMTPAYFESAVHRTLGEIAQTEELLRELH
jgi:HD-like signal output (HDOD) protein